MRRGMVLMAGLIAALGIACCPGPSAALVVRDAAALALAIENANWHGGDRNIWLEDGVYSLDDMLWVEASGVTVRSVSGVRENVILQGRGMTGDVSHVFNIAADDFTVGDVTIRNVANHGLQTQIDVDRLLVSNVVFQDTGEQMLKVAYDPDRPTLASDDGVVENCLFEYTAGVGPQYYIGGIDAHLAKNWVIRGNIFKNIASPADDVAEHAVHFWSNSEGTLVERNLIINCDRGIGFGLGDRGHIGGIIRNNMIYHNDSGDFSDVGIGLESARGAQVYNNTIFMEHGYPNAIEYRFGESYNNLIANHLVNRGITSRDGGQAELFANNTGAHSFWFVDPATGDLHLNQSLRNVVDAAHRIEGLSEDFDGTARPQGRGFDIGAHEFAPEVTIMPIGAAPVIVF